MKANFKRYAPIGVSIYATWMKKIANKFKTRKSWNAYIYREGWLIIDFDWDWY